MRKYIFMGFSLLLTTCLLTVVVGCRFITKEKAIHKAAYKGDLNKVKKMIERNPARINVQDWHGKTPLYYASVAGHTEIAEFLLSHNADIELGNTFNERPLAKAAKFGHYETVKILLEHGAIVNCKDKYGQTPLHEGARSGNKDIVEILLSYGADVCAKDKHNKTPLHEAAMRNNKEVAKMLVEHGADLFAKDNNNQTPKEVALQCDRDNKEAGLQYDNKELVQYLQTKEDEKEKGI